MGELVPHAFDPEPVEAPPDGSIAGAAWLAKQLRRELHAIMSDRVLSTKQRRDELIRFAKAITSATPNEELYEARKAIREDEQESKPTKLRGKLTRAGASRTGHLRANAPRGREG